ncbi:MAG: sulfatase-like hydrolase/transferase [Rikenellaceae bacterium]
MNNRLTSLFLVAGAIAPATTIAAPKAAKAERPNIIIMLADDMGYDDMSLRGNTCVNTPNLDQMAQTSTSFENFYVHSVSAPTRASLLTGRHFLRVGVSGVHAGRDFVNLDEVMISEAFKEAGYKTGMWGKWHSGKTPGYYPWDRGFDEAYFAELYRHKDNKGLLNGEKCPLEGWTDPNMTDMAIKFINKNKKSPFFAYLPFLAPHGSWEAPEDAVQKKMAEGQSRSMATLSAMIEQVDTQVGKVFKAVEKAGILDNTIIIFLCDNGPINGGNPQLTPEEWKLRNPSEYRGNKGQNFENGIHSPLFVYWKGHYEGVVNNSLVAVYDLFPTLCDIAGVEIPERTKELDGVSFREILENPTLCKRDRSLYISQWAPFFEWHDASGVAQSCVLTSEKRASIDPTIQMLGVRTGDDKMLYNMWGEDTLALWNIAKDYKESKNLYTYGTEADRARAVELRNETVKWYEDLLANDKSHQMPTFLIGDKWSNLSQIVTYGATRITEGLINDNHYLKGFDQAGEGAEYKVKVTKAGAYSFGIRTKGGFTGSARFVVYTNTNDNCGEIIVSGKVTSWLNIKLTKDVTMVGIRLVDSIGSCDLTTIDILDKTSGN